MALNAAIAEAQSNSAGDAFAEPAALHRAVVPLLDHLDVPRITALLLGRHWRTAGATERVVVQNALVGHLIARHAPSLRRLHHWQLRLLAAPPAPAGAGTARVPVAIGARGLPEMRVDLHLSRRDGRWLIYDASLSGIGLIGTLRPALTMLAAERGLGGLIAALAP
jgi:phospholipid transport system substrate-binding protein